EVDCLVCPLEPFFVKKNLLGQIEITVIAQKGGQRKASVPGLKSTLEATFNVRPDGIVDQVHIKHAPNKEIEEAVKSNIETWVLSPPTSNGSLAGGKRQLEINVTCLAFPASEEGTCTLRPVT